MYLSNTTVLFMVLN